MIFLDAMLSRYTTKVYDHTKKINDQSIENLKEILRLSPSSINSLPWKFTFVRDQTLLRGHQCTNAEPPRDLVEVRGY